MENQVAVITGAGNGLGLELTRNCLNRGMSVVMVDNDVNALSEQVFAFTKAGFAVMGSLCDVRDVDSINNLVNEVKDNFGRVDWLINNAGIAGSIAPLWEQNLKSVKNVMDVNLMGAIQVTHAFLPFMFEQTWRSRVINIASVYALCSASSIAAYTISKHAMLAFSESLYFDLKRYEKPVDVSIAFPSFINTGLLNRAKQESDQNLHEIFCNLMEKSRPAEDIAASILREAENNLFYILPDREVEMYCEQRLKAISDQQVPYMHSLEKIVTALGKRVQNQSSGVVV